MTSSIVEDAAVKAIVDPYVALLAAYNDKTIGATTAPIDTMSAFTQETNGANLQADASVWELEDKTVKCGLPSFRRDDQQVDRHRRHAWILLPEDLGHVRCHAL